MIIFLIKKVTNISTNQLLVQKHRELYPWQFPDSKPYSCVQLELEVVSEVEGFNLGERLNILLGEFYYSYNELYKDVYWRNLSEMPLYEFKTSDTGSSIICRNDPKFFNLVNIRGVSFTRSCFITVEEFRDRKISEILL